MDFWGEGNISNGILKKNNLNFSLEGKFHLI